MIDPAVFRAMVANGASPEMLLAVVEASAAVEEEKRAKKRAGNAERQARFRAAHKTDDDDSNASNALQAVTERDGVTSPPVLDKEIPPRPPKEINPTPRATRASALARKAGGFGPPTGVDMNTWNVFCSQRKKPISEIAYDRMLTTLAECADVGWPPGEIVERSIEKTWETLYVPTERRNGSRPANDHREQPESPWRTALRQAEAREAH
jgi:hypothetical protein